MTESLCGLVPRLRAASSSGSHRPMASVNSAPSSSISTIIGQTPKPDAMCGHGLATGRQGHEGSVGAPRHPLPGGPLGSHYRGQVRGSSVPPPHHITPSKMILSQGPEKNSGSCLVSCLSIVGISPWERHQLLWLDLLPSWRLYSMTLFHSFRSLFSSCIEPGKREVSGILRSP